MASAPDADDHAHDERALLLGLAKLALSGAGREALVAEALRCAAVAANSEFSKLMEETPEGDFLATAGHGWAAGEVVGHLHLPGGAAGSPSGRAIATDASVRSYSGTGAGTSVPAALTALGIGSSIDTPVRGTAGSRGVLQVDRRSAETFSAPAEGRLEDVSALLGYALDARDRETAEAARIAAAHALLVREVDHRVANSLALVASTLRIQARALARQGGDAVPLIEAAARIGGIATLHRHLQRTARAGGDEVEVAPLLGDVVQDLAAMLYPGEAALSFVVEAPGLLWPSKRASALCLIAAELVTNAARHGGPGRPATLRLAMDAAGDVLLVMEDEGPGFPAGFDAEAQGNLGMQLIRGVAGPGGGRIPIGARPEGGARITVRVSLDAS
jgi:two-component sensor histidine kinase